MGWKLNRAVARTVGRRALILFNVLVFGFLIWIVAVNFLGFPYRLGVDGQKIRCLPWSVFIIKRGMPEEIKAGDLIQFKAGTLGYGFDGLLFVKMVGAVPGDRVVIRNDQLYINDRLRDRLWLIKALKKKPGDFDRSFVVPQGELLMLGTVPESFDGRYWGTIKREQILGSSYPLF